MKPTLFITLFFLYCNLLLTGFAQNQKSSGEHGLVSKAEQNRTIDSLIAVLNEHKQDDTAEVNTLNNLSNLYCRTGEYAKAMEKAEQAAEISKKIDFKKGLADVYNNIGEINLYLSNHTEACNSFNECLKIKKELNDKKGEAAIYHNIGIVYAKQDKYSDALRNLISSLKVKEELGDKKGIANSYSAIGLIYQKLKNYEEALRMHKRSLKTRIEIGDKLSISVSLDILGNIYQELGNYSEALNNHKEALNLKKEIKHVYGTGISYESLGNIYVKQKSWNEALLNFETSLEIFKSMGDMRGIAVSYLNIGSVKFYLKEYAEAQILLKDGLAIFIKIESKEKIVQSYLLMSMLDSSIGNWKSAYEYHKLFKQYHDSIFNEENSKSIAEMQTKYETEKKEKQIEIQNLQLSQKELEINKRQFGIYAVSSGLVLMLILALVIYRSYLHKNKLNEKLSAQNATIEHKNKNITDSIDYASRIQNALLPPEEKFKQVFSDAFVFFQPKDIVSGDFYWGTQLNNKVVFAAVDCTGHGVPGAFMSLIGSNLLDKIIGESHIVEPNLILDKLHIELHQRLHHDEYSEMRDGMDIVMCSVDLDTLELELAGAHNSAYIISDNALREIKTDNCHLGNMSSMKDKKFTKHKIQLKKNDIVYLFSDGFPDQKGGPKNKKFYYAPFKELLQKNHSESMKKQKEILASTINNWIGTGRQIDDMLVLGVKVG